MLKEIPNDQKEQKRSVIKTLGLGLVGFFSGEGISPEEVKELHQRCQNESSRVKQQLESFERTLQLAAAARERSVKALLNVK